MTRTARAQATVVKSRQVESPARNGGRNGLRKVTRRQIQSVVDRIVTAMHPEKVILFGSYANGKPTVDSDVDLLIVMESEEREAQRAIRIEMQLLDVPFPMDILVRTPAEIAARLKTGDFFIREVVERGQILYER